MYFIIFRSIIEAPFITYSDIQIGSMVKVIIYFFVKYELSGVLK